MLNNFLRSTFVALGGDKIFMRLNRAPRVLYWHGIGDSKYPDVEQENLSTDIFKKQLSYLKRYYDVISMDEFEKRFFSDSFSGKEIVLTFDDGYANNLYVAAPILAEYELPFTVFVSTEHIETGMYYPTTINRILTRGAGLKYINIPILNRHYVLDNQEHINYATQDISSILKANRVEDVKRIVYDMLSHNVSESEWGSLKEKYDGVRPMNWDEVKQLASLGAVIGSHCAWHACLHQNQLNKEIKFQLEESKRSIEEHLGVECRFFAYPNGDFTDGAIKTAESCYSMSFTTCAKSRIKSGIDVGCVPRIGNCGDMNVFKIATNLYPYLK